MQLFGRSIAFGSLLLLLSLDWASAREVSQRPGAGAAVAAPRTVQPLNSLTDNGIPRGSYRSAAGTDTTFLGSWNFEGDYDCDPQGWISVDRTPQTGTYFHVDDFAGLGGGDFGRLVPLQGNQSLWCGARPDANDPVLCRYGGLPGYGNNWDQIFCTANCLIVNPPYENLEISFLISRDSEQGYDYTYVEFDEGCDDNWEVLAAYDGVGTEFARHDIPFPEFQIVRFRIRFVSDFAYSDEDGGVNTDGAVIIDSLTVRDLMGIILPTELFEVESVGDNSTASGNWVTYTPPGYGDFAGMFPGTEVVQEDPCVQNTSCLWAFFEGSTYNYACGGFPNQQAVPYRNARYQYIVNQIWSPEIPITGSGSDFELRFDVYEDLPIDALVGYYWEVRSIVDGCPGEWKWRDWIPSVGFGYKHWSRPTCSLGQYVDPAATHLQIALGVEDLCPQWGGMYGTCNCHTHAPLFDNVEVIRIARSGPEWQVSDADLFQDTFPEDGTITGTARADMARDLLPRTNPAILPGDSVVARVWDNEYGLDFHTPGNPASGAAVYCYVSVDGPNAGTPSANLIDDPRYSVIGTVPAGGRTWTQIQMDTCWTGDGGHVPDKYNIDLNDNLFVPQDTVYFFFGARSAPPSSDWTYYAVTVPTQTGETDDIDEAAANADEFQILPATGTHQIPPGEILYVDGMDGRGAQPYFDWAFRSLPHFEFWQLYDYVDRYDIRAPTSTEGNHPGTRVVNAVQQLVGVYSIVIWDCGDLSTAFSDGSVTHDKSDDTGLLLTFLDYLETYGGVYLCGDDVADEWSTFTSASATTLRSWYMEYSVVDYDHNNLSLGVSPLVVGEPFSMFRGTGGIPDTLIAYGGCPGLNDFDVLAPAGVHTELEASYHGRGTTGGAIVAQEGWNRMDQGVVGFVLSGFGYQYTRDTTARGVPARSIHLKRIIDWMATYVGDPVTAESNSYTNSLSQNYPNPFNPTTTIRYSIAERGHVSLRIYNVAGQLVRTLVDDIQSPETVEPVAWDGRNDAGQMVSSGVYFYKLTTEGFTKTKKMAVLK